MTDFTRDIHLFATVARIEATLAAHRLLLQRLPQEMAGIDRAVAKLDADEKKAHDELEEMRKKRRDTERKLREDEDHLKKIRGQQALIKTNEEYTAMLREVANLESAISQEEETLLILMDQMEAAEKAAAERAGSIQAERGTKAAEKSRLEAEIARLTADAQKLSGERPKILSEITPALVKRYERLVERHRDVAVTRVDHEHCGACRQQIPPQLAVEVRKNDQFITCPACGRILVHYAD
jgi:predicted  nucleic acid-binding Zn-ribbon protein